MDKGKLESAFKRFADNPADLLEGALLVSALVQPLTDPAWCRRTIQELTDKLSLPTVEALLELFHREGFAGADTYYEARNSAVDYVLKERRGIPITLAVILIEVARRAGLAAAGINFPGHFLVSIAERVVDPFTLQALSEQACKQRLAASGVRPEVAWRRASNTAIVLRMLNNLRGIALQSGDSARALEYTDYQLQLNGDRLELALVRAELWVAIGAPQIAVHELETAKTLNPGAELTEQIDQRLSLLAKARPSLH